MRMLAMKNATDNANDIIGDLTLEFNTARQSAIHPGISRNHWRRGGDNTMSEVWMRRAPYPRKIGTRIQMIARKKIEQLTCRIGYDYEALNGALVEV